MSSTPAEDEASKKRMERFHALAVLPTPPSMNFTEYAMQFTRRWFVNLKVLDEVERSLRVMMCHNCMEKALGTDRIGAFPFFVVIEQDELRVFPALAHVSCHGCGFEEYYPTSRPASWGLEQISPRDKFSQLIKEHTLMPDHALYGIAVAKPPDMSLQQLSNVQKLRKKFGL